MYVQTGHVRNTGVEAMLGYTHTWRGFTWDSAVTFSWNKNKIVELMRNWRDPETGKVYSKDRLEIKGLGRAKYILKEGGSMGDLYTTPTFGATPTGTSRSTTRAMSPSRTTCRT